jgi:hypothetical protein
MLFWPKTLKDMHDEIEFYADRRRLLFFLRGIIVC